MNIHPTTLTYEQYPSVYNILQSTVFMWFIVVVTLGIFAWTLSKLWYIHSIPKHLAKERGLSQAKLVFWLCILGMFYKPLWVIAVLTIVTDWDKIQNWLRGASS